MTKMEMVETFFLFILWVCGLMVTEMEFEFRDQSSNHHDGWDGGLSGKTTPCRRTGLFKNASIIKQKYILPVHLTCLQYHII